MKLWCIKLGKAVTALQKEGVMLGGKRILTSFFSLFRRVGRGEVLIITGGLGDSARYRAWHVAEELTLHGIPAQVAVQDNPFLSRYVPRFSVFVFHRTMVTPAIKRMIAKIKKQKKTILFDTDDLVFDEKYFQHMDMFGAMNAFEKMQYRGGVGAEILSDPSVSVCTATTNFLCEILRKRGKKVYLVPNRLCREDILLASDIVAEKTKPGGKQLESPVVIGYFSGTKSHNRDFLVAAPALLRILEKFPKTRLFLAGPLDQGSVLQRFHERIESTPYVPRRENFRNIARCAINIAPLEIGNPFCEAKSQLKFFEAGIVSVPTVASATQPYCDAISDGVDGFLARNEEEWFTKLSMLVEDEELRHSIGENARQTALANFTTERAENAEYYEFVKSKVCKVEDKR